MLLICDHTDGVVDHWTARFQDRRTHETARVAILKAPMFMSQGSARELSVEAKDDDLVRIVERRILFDVIFAPESTAGYKLTELDATELHRTLAAACEATAAVHESPGYAALAVLGVLEGTPPPRGRPAAPLTTTRAKAPRTAAPAAPPPRRTPAPTRRAPRPPAPPPPATPATGTRTAPVTRRQGRPSARRYAGTRRSTRVRHATAIAATTSAT